MSLECTIDVLGKHLECVPVYIEFDEIRTGKRNKFNYVVVATMRPTFFLSTDLSLNDIDVSREYMVYVEADGLMKCVLFR